MKRCSITILAISLVLVSSTQASLIILGNLPAANDNFGAVVDSGMDGVGAGPINVRWAISFTMPTQSYPVDHVALRLREYDTTAGDVAAVGFYLDNGNDLPGALVGHLLMSPSSNSTDLGQFDFTPTSPLTLDASTKYWLLVDAIAGDYYLWLGSSPAIMPTSQVGAIFGREVLLRENVPENSDGVSNFEIVSSVPEPSARLLVLGLIFLFPKACWRKNNGRLSLAAVERQVHHTVKHIDVRRKLTRCDRNRFQVRSRSFYAIHKRGQPITWYEKVKNMARLPARLG